MNRPKISQMEAYIIETLRSNGLTNEEIINDTKEKNITKWKQITEQYDFEHLLALANKDFATFEQIINEGYTVKFVTAGGLERLLRLKFGKEPEKDYTKGETGIHGLVIDKPAVNELQQMLSSNWKLEKNDQGILVKLKEQQGYN